MNTKKIITAAIAIIATATASIAKEGPRHNHKQIDNPETIVSIMIAEHDQNDDGGLNVVELAESIESLYDFRNSSIRNHREHLAEYGRIPAADNGVVTLSLMPEDGAAILMLRADANNDAVLGADELIASTREWRSLSLGARSFFGS